MLAEFGSIGAVLAGSRPRQLRAASGDAAAVRTLRRFRYAMHLALSSRVAQAPLLSGADTLRAYLMTTIGYSKVETFRVLHLDSQNRLLRDTVIATGTIDRAWVPIREVIARALELGSAALILVHNHPSDNTRPTRSDIDLTHKIMRIAKPLDIAIHDHLIVGSTQIFSFQEAGYLS